MQMKEGITPQSFEAGVASLRLSDTNSGMEILENMFANMFAMELWWISV